MSTQTPARPSTTPTDRDNAGLGRPWQVVVANDNHNSFDYVIALFCQVLPGVEASQAEGLAWAIHTKGREVVWSGHQELAEHYGSQLRVGGLRASSEPAP